MRLSSVGSAVYAPLASNPPGEKGDGVVIPTPSSSYPPLPSTPTILSGLPLDFSRESLLNIRLLAFFVIEAGYITLAAVCLTRPLPLNIPFSLTETEVKSGFTVLFVVWQILAIFISCNLVADAFSQEWSAQLERCYPGESGGPPAVVPVGVDRVSTITSGFFDRVHHLFVDKSSGTFKLAFLASLSFLVLRSLGPGTINVGTTLVDRSTTVQIGRLFSHVDDSEAPFLLSLLLRAKIAVQFEQGEGSVFGFKLPPNTLAPVPKVDLASFNGTIEYDSDVIEFHHDCHWEAPQFFNTSGKPVIVAAGQQWYLPPYEADQVTIGSSISPMYLKNSSMMGDVGTTAFIFAGGNSSFLDQRFNPPVRFGIDLGSLPTTWSAPGPHLASDTYYAPLSSVLACNPNAQITGGRIRVTNDGTLTVITSGKPPIGNIPRSAANLIFTSALMVPLNNDDIGNINGVNGIASAMFMSSSSAINWTDAHGIHPSDLSSINKNMDSSVLSGAKAYIDGYRRNGSSLVISFELDAVSAVERSQTLALMTSKRFFCVTTVFAAISTIVLLVLCQAGLAQKRDPFDLNHVVAVLKGERRREREATEGNQRHDL